MLAAAALGALGAQLEQLQAAKQDWFVGASLVDEQDISLEADGAVTVRRQAFDKALRNFPKTDSPSKAKAARKMEVTDYDQVIAGERFCSRSERQALASAAATARPRLHCAHAQASAALVDRIRPVRQLRGGGTSRHRMRNV